MNSTATPEISIIIRCYNEEAHIARLLSGISQQTRKDVEVILVDSGSTDATLAIASRYPVQVLHIKKENFSFGYSLNTGCEAASGEYLVIASAHVYPVYYDWIERLVSHFQDKRVGLVYGKQRGNEVTKFSEHQVFAKWFPDESDANQSNPFCNNANAAIRKSLWEQSRYDETLTGLEDLAWAKRIQAAGQRIVYDADAEIIHVHDETMKSIYNRYRREAIAMKSAFPNDRFNFIDFIRMYTGNVISDCRVAAKSGALRGNFSDILGFRLMQFLGTWRGFAQHGPVTRQLKNKFYYPQTGHLTSANGERHRSAPAIDYSDNSPD